MKKINIIVGTIILSTSLVSTPLFADSDRIPFSAVPLAKIVSNLQEQGYSAITSVEFDEGIYEAEVVTNQGQQIELKINPASGEIINKPAPLKISLNEALEKAKEAGYVDPYKIEADNNGYKIKAFEGKGDDKVKIFINGNTGTITTGGFW